MTPSLQGWMPLLLAWQEFGGNGNGTDPAAEAFSVVAIIVMLVFYALIFAVAIAMIVLVYYVLYSSVARIPPQHRSIEPGQVFLLLIPFFNLYWNSVVFTKIPQSYQRYFGSIGVMHHGDCGEQLGIWTATLLAVSLIPCVNFITGPIAGIMGIIMLVKFWSLRNQIPAPKTI